MPDLDQEIFASAFTDEQPEPSGDAGNGQQQTDPAAQQGDEGRNRDPVTGQFVEKPEPKAGDEGQQQQASVENDGQQQPEPQGDQGQQATIPSGRLREEAEARRRAEAERDDLRRQLDETNRRFASIEQRLNQPPQRQEPEQPPPSIYDDPDAFVQRAIDPVQRQQDQIIERFSKMMAVQQFGQETVNKAFDELAAEVQANPVLRFEAQRIWKSEHPYGELVGWYKNRQALKEIGSDPAAYRQKLRDELIKDPEVIKAVLEGVRTQQGGGQQQQPNGNGAAPNNTIKLPPSLTRAPAAQPNNNGVETDPSDRELFTLAMRG